MTTRGVWPRSQLMPLVMTLGLTACGVMAMDGDSELLEASPDTARVATPSAVLTPLPEPYEVELIGERFAWRMRHPGRDHVLGSSDDWLTDGRFILPADHPVTIRLTSLDYVYTWGLPAKGAEQIAVPGMRFEVALPPLSVGRWTYEGSPFCGGEHSRLAGAFDLLPVADFPTVVAAAAATREPLVGRAVRRE